MSVVVGIDLGTTTITALALSAESGDVLATVTVPNAAEMTSPEDRARGRSEWDARAIVDAACDCLRRVSQRIGANWARLAGLGMTGQQHGTLIVNELRPLTPFVNWQDRRGEEPYPGGGNYVEEALRRAGDGAAARTGCRLAAGYMAVTLFWWRANRALPPDGQACFLTDFFGGLLTGSRPVTDPTFAASGGAFDLRAGAWDAGLIEALGLSPALFPEVRPSGAALGTITAAMAEPTDLPEGLPVFVGIGDNQASFLGSVADRDDSVLVNVGTGGQVSVYLDEFRYEPLLETRPFPGGGYLLAEAGLCGGRSHALLERFYRQVGEQLCGADPGEPLYAVMNRLSDSVPRGAGGLVCEPFFAGTRYDPGRRAAWTGVSAENFTPGHMARALLEGMARAFRGGYDAIGRLGGGGKSRLVGAGNGLRENPVLARCVADEFGLPLSVPLHHEEAAFGAALTAAVGAGLFPDLPAAGGLVRYAKR
ncbi:MAG TPA: FGGY family carbohydrate kinase [Gemmataceae bacterium]|nr:FGGY family carbohydrate kinase [Gemmataceae bacterium]